MYFADTASGERGLLEERAMATHGEAHPVRERGFSLIEMLVVVGIIGIMAAVALPNIGQYIRNYRIRGAAQLVSGEIQAARSKAIMSNTNAGVSFVVVDADSYRYVMEDLPAGEQLSPLKDLPTGVRFVVATTMDAGPSVRFTRLGGFCNPAAGGSCGAAAAVTCTTQEAATRCNREAGANYVGTDDALLTGGLVVTLLEETTGLRRTIRLAPGGRVLPQP
jgi:prepilin-type N-terminal cleavage/methylation domain-containing protein